MCKVTGLQSVVTNRCGRYFVEASNEKCYYHPGKWKELDCVKIQSKCLNVKEKWNDGWVELL
jgi:hypothetical protein